MDKFIIILCAFVLVLNTSCNKPLSQLECHQSGFKVAISWDEKAGTLTANTTNGAPPFMYNWSNGNTNFMTINVNNVKGLYAVTVTDFETCVVYASFEIK
jgi:hypothetical protein